MSALVDDAVGGLFKIVEWYEALSKIILSDLFSWGYAILSPS